MDFRIKERSAWKKMQIKTNQKGVTLVSLVLYVIALTIVVAIMTTMSTYFYTNIGGVLHTPKYLAEFNKFTMFFVTDVKGYSSATVTSDTIQFENGPTYKYQDGEIYRNDLKIAEYIMDCDFSMWQYTVNSFSKNIINVNLKIGESEEEYFIQDIDFTLKYW